jgi:cyclic pyranopterin phosphate synthase
MQIRMTTQASGTNSLIDPLGRRIDYLRLSVTDKCNLRCFYCLPKDYRDFGNRDEYLTFDETERVVGAFADLGVHRVRITGGEPLVRKNLPELAQRLSALPGVEDLSLSTNAMLLAQHAGCLHAAGVRRLNVSLDTLRAERFREITGHDGLDRVLDGLRAAKATGFNPIKINMLALKGRNDDEIEDMVEFCIEHAFSLRFIETMPIGTAGRLAAEHYIDLNEIRSRLQQTYDLVPSVMPGGGPARYYRINGSGSNARGLHIGFITPISQHFCDTCNRVRLSVDGTLHLCLGQEHSVALRPLLRKGIDDEELRQAIVRALMLKPARHEFNDKPEQVIRFMSSTGG